MTVRDLITMLQAVPNQDAIVILQKDSEGNGYGPLAAEFSAGDVFSVDRYHADSTYSGEVYDHDDEDAPEGGEPCVVLWPIN